MTAQPPEILIYNDEEATLRNASNIPSNHTTIHQNKRQLEF